MSTVAPPSTEQLWRTLRTGLRRRGEPGQIVAFERRPSPYRTSHAVEEVDVRLHDGRALALIFKDLRRVALEPAARRAKPRFLHDPRREIRTYRDVLRNEQLGTAHCYASHIDTRAQQYWLFIERVPGVELFQIGNFEVWCEAARWLARFHQYSRHQTTRRLGTTLIDYDAAFYRHWLLRARALACPRSATSQEHGRAWRSAMLHVLDCYELVIEQLVSMPRTIVHGEFYPANVIVRGEAGVRICPIDWEMTALAPPLMDLAALVAGGWSDYERELLIDAYRVEASAAPLNVPAIVDARSLRPALDCCRLHVAVQWLAWSRRWTPPVQQRHDWLGEALQVAEELRL